MKIPLEQLKEGTIEIIQDLPITAWDMNSLYAKFLDDMHVECKLMSINNEIFIEGELDIKLEIICSRCLRQTNQSLRQKFSKNYFFKDIKDDLDLKEDMREAILLNFPMKFLCQKSCKGICFKCGKDLNDSKCECIITENKIKIDTSLSNLLQE